MKFTHLHTNLDVHKFIYIWTGFSAKWNSESQIFFFYLLLFFFLVSVWASSLLSKQESFLPLPTYTSAIEMSANAFGKKEDFDH